MKVMVIYRADDMPDPPVPLPDKITAIATQVSQYTAHKVTQWIMKMKGTGRFGTTNSFRLAYRMVQHVILALNGEIIRINIDFEED